ncbi:hypothetical protein [Chitinophaga tropicalis]|uniref:Auto-transporter adhesin head GIN domain-containing protein n=1 Tax=Chitinophaga tropicalis TaxID=2683588 RepID=A0A7K1U2D8_9BACT|nr:hypothetical protein [Chitinophaga tropicalis]MVT08470.1 hypothetical protein [Chitinophaga tropicalis]
MKTCSLRFVGLLAITALVFTGCSKQTSNETTERPDGSATINYDLAAVNPSGTITADADGAARLSTIMNDPSIASFPALRFDLTWDSVIFRFRELRFQAVSGPDEINLSIKTDRDINILDSVSLGSIMVPIGTFEQVKVYLRVEGDTVRPAIKMNGRITWQGSDIPIDVVVVGKIEVMAEGKDVVISENGLGLLGDLKIDLSVILSKLKIGDFEGSFENGKLTLTINLNKNPNNGLKKAFDGSMSVEHKRK